MKHKACFLTSSSLFKGNVLSDVDMVSRLNLICYRLSLLPRPVSLKWSDWSVMWSCTGFPSSVPADIQESPPGLQHPARTSLTLTRPLALRQAECHSSVCKHTQKRLASLWKVESRRRRTVPSPAPPAFRCGRFRCTGQTSAAVWSFSGHKDTGVKPGSCLGDASHTAPRC